MDVMNEENALIIVAPYVDIASAGRDFHNLRKLAKRPEIELREAVLVTKDSNGVPTVVETTTRHATAGAGWGAGVGLLLGLLVPPLVVSAAIGAVAGALVAKFADHLLSSDLRHDVGQALERGTAVVIAMVKPGGQPAVERALSASATKSVVTFAESTIASIEAEIEAAMKTLTADTSPAGADTHGSVVN
jgi:uncharacterized membrane protein